MSALEDLARRLARNVPAGTDSRSYVDSEAGLLDAETRDRLAAMVDALRETGYTVERQYEGLYYVIDSEDDSRVASAGRFMPGPMVSVSAPSITPPALARAIAAAMVALADELEGGA